jgi:hypothetical protein
MVMKIKGIKWVMLIFALVACEEIIDDERSSADPNLIVVEGIITNERLNHKIKLSRPYREQNGTVVPVSGSIVRITDGEDTVMLTEMPSGSGEYYTPAARAVFGKTYTLIIEHEGKTFFASDSAEPVEPLPEISLAENNGSFSLINNPSGDEPNFIDHLITWRHTPGCEGECDGSVIFYDLKTVDVNEFYKPRNEKFMFPENTIIIRKKYSVSPAFKGYLRAMMSETRWRGGVFDVERDNVPTNLSVGATGFFAVSTVVSDTAIVKN